MKAGDIFLYSGAARTDRLIQVATHSPWNHCGVVITDAGGTVEALATGVAIGDIGRFESVLVVPLALDDEERDRALVYVEGLVGERYGVVTIFGNALALLTGLPVVVAMDRRPTCSVLVAKYLAHTKYAIDEMDEDRVRPCDVAAHFDLTKGEIVAKKPAPKPTEFPTPAPLVPPVRPPAGPPAPPSA